jgi:hypothetical protein
VPSSPAPRRDHAQQGGFPSRESRLRSRSSNPALQFSGSWEKHRQGIGEGEDVTAVLDYLGTRFPPVRVCLLGYSFGASVALRVGASDPRVAALVGLGVPVASTNLDFLRGVLKPKLIIQGTRDQFGPRAQMESFYASLAGPKQIYWVQNADHFFTGKLAEVQHVIREFLRSELIQVEESRSRGLKSS